MKFLARRLHQLFGLAAGGILAIMGLTGALLAFREEMIYVLNPSLQQIAHEHADGRSPLPLARLLDQLPIPCPTQLTRLILDPSGQRPSLAQFACQPAPIFFDPYTGAILPKLRGQSAMATVEALHRYLAYPGVGQTLTMISTLALLGLAGTGIIRYWPQRWWHWHAWWPTGSSQPGSGLLARWHIRLGVACCTIYLMIAITGLQWSIPWYRQQLSHRLGIPAWQQPSHQLPAHSATTLATVVNWLDHHDDDRSSRYLDLRWSNDPQAGPLLRLRAPDASHEMAFDLPRFRANQYQNTLPYHQLPWGQQLWMSVLALHRGSVFGLPGRIIWAGAAVCLPGFFISGCWLFWRRRQPNPSQTRRASSATDPQTRLR